MYEPNNYVLNQLSPCIAFCVNVLVFNPQKRCVKKYNKKNLVITDDRMPRAPLLVITSGTQCTYLRVYTEITFENYYRMFLRRCTENEQLLLFTLSFSNHDLTIA